MMQEDQKGCKKNRIRAEDEHITAARTKQHEDEEDDSGIGPKTTRDKKKPKGVLKNVVQDQKGCKKNMCAEEGQITDARTKNTKTRKKITA